MSNVATGSKPQVRFVKPFLSARKGLRKQQLILAADEAMSALEHALLWLQVRFVVMGNVFPSDVKLHRRYDLKGSTFGRTAAKKAGNPNTVLKVSPGAKGVGHSGSLFKWTSAVSEQHGRRESHVLLSIDALL